MRAARPHAPRCLGSVGGGVLCSARPRVAERRQQQGQQQHQHQQEERQPGARAAAGRPQPEQQQQEQGARRRRQGQQQPEGAGAPRQQQQQQQQRPFLVRIAGRTSSVQGAAGAISKRLTEDLVRVAAIDANSILKALIALTAANNMAAANSASILVFQPTLVSGAAAEPPRVPDGALVMYTAQVLRGEVMAFNTLCMRPSTDAAKLSKAIISRIKGEGHTVLECFGPVAATTALLAAAQARKGLLRGKQDLACIITSQLKGGGAAAGSGGSGGGSGGGSVRTAQEQRRMQAQGRPSGRRCATAWCCWSASLASRARCWSAPPWVTATGRSLQGQQQRPGLRRRRPPSEPPPPTPGLLLLQAGSQRAARSSREPWQHWQPGG